MIRKSLFLGVPVFLALAALSFGAAFLITITAPPNGATLLIGSTYTIRWTHSSDFVAHPQKCDVYCGVDVISPPVPVTDDQFVWTVGLKKDGTYLVPGNYEITIESPDYDALNGPFINLAALTLDPDILKKKIPLERINCPLCFNIDPRLFKFEMKGLEAIDVSLFRLNREIVKLGRYAPGKMPQAPVSFKLTEKELSAIQKSLDAFEIRAFSLKGELLLKQAIQVEIVK